MREHIVTVDAQFHGPPSETLYRDLWVMNVKGCLVALTVQFSTFETPQLRD